MSAKGQNALVFELLDHLLGSWWTIVAGVAVGLSGALVALHYLPKTYEASTKIFATPPKIPQDMIRSTIQDDMSLRMEALKEVMLSRKSMEDLLKATVGLPKDEEAQERLINQLQSRVDVAVVRYNRGNAAQSAALFSLTFRDKNPALAANIVNTLAQLYIAENKKNRSVRAEDTVETMQQLADKVRKDLEARDREIAAFRSQHLHETADQLDPNLRQIDTRQRDLETNEKSLSAALDRLQGLKSQENQTTVLTSPSGSTITAADPTLARRALLEHELEQLRGKYKDDHPEVRAKKRELDEFIAAIPKAPEGSASDGAIPSAALSPLQRQIRDQEKEIARLRADGQQIRTDIAELNRRVEVTPRNEARLSELRKDYDVLQAQYRDYKTKAETAKGAQHIEETQQGETFEVIDRAVVPSLPVQPNPAMVFGVGVLAGLVLFVAPGILLRLIRPVVASEAGLRGLADVPVLVSLPMLETPDALSTAHRRRNVNVWLSVAALSVLALTLFLLKGA